MDFEGPYANWKARRLSLSLEDDDVVLSAPASLFGRREGGEIAARLDSEALESVWLAIAADRAGVGTNGTPIVYPDQVHAHLVVTAEFDGCIREFSSSGLAAARIMDAALEKVCELLDREHKPIGGLWSKSSEVVFYNPHPKRYSVGDCTKRALTKVTGLSYKQVSDGMNAIKAEVGAKRFNERAVTSALLERSGAKKLTLGENSLPETVAMFARVKAHDGAWIVNPKRHWVACVDHKAYDSWDSSDEPVERAWRVNPEELSRALLDAAATRKAS